MFDECLALYDAWAAHRAARDMTDAIYRQMLAENAAVHRRALRYHQRLGLIGRVVRIGGAHPRLHLRLSGESPGPGRLV